MNNISYFNVIGPVMIGPSSSHTAGAVRIGKAASSIVENGFNRIVFKLHGSFKETYKGHGTDKALIAGCLGFMPDDERIKTAYEIAAARGIEVEFRGVDLVNAHPNTAILEFYYPDGLVKSVKGISTGGGQIEITCIDGADVRLFPGDSTVIVQYHDRKGIIAALAGIIAENDYNIEKIMSHTSEERVTLVLVLDRKLDEATFQALRESGKYDHISYVYF